jgi:hypothetical protein
MIDTLTNGTVGAGMIVGQARAEASRSAAGAILLLVCTGACDLVAEAIERRIHDRNGRAVVVRAGRLATQLVAAGAVARAGIIAVVPVDASVFESDSGRELVDSARAYVVRVEPRLSVDEAAQTAVAVLPSTVG